MFATEPMPVDALFERASVVEIGGKQVRVASRADLITMKRRAGRPQDVADIAALEALGDA